MSSNNTVDFTYFGNHSDEFPKYPHLKRLYELDDSEVEKVVDIIANPSVAHEIEALLHHELEKIAGGSTTIPGEATSIDMHLFFNQRFSLNLRTLGYSRPSEYSFDPAPSESHRITLVANDIVLAPIAGAIELKLYAKSGEKVALQETRTLQQGHTILLSKGKHGIWIAEDSNALVLELAYAQDPLPSVEHYDVESGSFVGLTSASVNATRLEYAIELICKFGSKNHLGKIHEIAINHPLHFIRWRALKNLCEQGYEHALDLLEYISKNDSSSELKEAASHTLSRVTNNVSRI